MALKLSGGKPPAPPEEEVIPAAAPEEPMEAMPEEMPVEEPLSNTAMVDPIVARYLGPENRCMSCIHFFEPGTCEIVMGPIDPQGVCSLYTADAMPEEPPMDAPVELPEAVPPTV